MNLELLSRWALEAGERILFRAMYDTAHVMPPNADGSFTPSFYPELWANRYGTCCAICGYLVLQLTVVIAPQSPNRVWRRGEEAPPAGDIISKFNRDSDAFAVPRLRACPLSPMLCGNGVTPSRLRTYMYKARQAFPFAVRRPARR